MQNFYSTWIFLLQTYYFKLIFLYNYKQDKKALTNIQNTKSTDRRVGMVFNLGPLDAIWIISSKGSIRFEKKNKVLKEER